MPCRNLIGLLIEPLLEHGDILAVTVAEIDVDHRIGLPVVVGGVDEESLEEFPLALEDRLQRADRKALAEAPWSGAEELFVGGDELVQVSGLVHIAHAIVDQILENEDAGGNLFHSSPPVSILPANKQERKAGASSRKILHPEA